MNPLSKRANITGWIVFAIATIIYFLTVERTGSLWDCGEFVLGAYKLQIVHPPGAPFFLLIGRLFTWVADLLSNNQSDIAFAVNLMSGICTAFAAMFVCWTTIMFGRLAYDKSSIEVDENRDIAINGAGMIAGLATAFSTSIWFSAVEGEVYAMSTMFTAMTLWAATKWYYLPEDPKNDKWMIFAFYAVGLSIGVHLLSLLVFSVIAIMIYNKKWKNPTWIGMLIACGVGIISTMLFQSIIISGIPSLWAFYEKLLVNSFGLPFHSGIVPTLLTLGAISYFGMQYAKKKGNDLLHKVVLTLTFIAISYSIVGVVIIRALANPPINMNEPNDVMRLLPYLNREQYGDRSLIKGPHFDARPINTKSTDRYGRVGNEYKVVDKKFDYVFKKTDEILLPRIGHSDQGRPQLYRMWMDYLGFKKDGPPSMAFNLSFLWNYQFGWMYWRYFMWNYVGRQNFEQGTFAWNKRDGNWKSGIKSFDSAKLYNQDRLPRVIREDKSTNSYYFIPLILGLCGVFFHFRHNKKDFWTLFSMWLLAGLALCFFSNSPPNEPRERDYVLVGSFMIFCIWIGMGAMFIFELLRDKVNMKGIAPAAISSCLGLAAPVIMCVQNYDDLGRQGITAARDYASNILESCKPNAIIFTYGDNDTYPVWYAQEVEGIRRDVRVINLSLIAVDWYIAAQRRKINESAPVKMSIPQEKYRGQLRNQVFYFNPEDPEGKLNNDREMSAQSWLKFIGEDHPLSSGSGREIETFMPSRNVTLEVSPEAALKTGMFTPGDSSVLTKIPINLAGKTYLTKDELAVIDIITSNIQDRPIYFSVTCQGDKLMGLDDYTEMDGMALRIVPFKSQSERNMYIYGAGKMDYDYTYDVIMNKYKWGNFDKQQLFVDKSYGPSVQAFRMIMMRLANGLLAKGDTERASAVAMKYFESFPNMNFQYDGRAMPFIQALLMAKKYDEAKKHIKILGDETLDMLEFFETLSPSEIQAGFQQDKAFAASSIPEILQAAKETGDSQFASDLEAKLKKFQTAPINN
ncbi:MAG TPA: DUF2723 domain-containing protein [Saprospiraceae bacterium]|nr:DUF2723 domain-containing protein [Saprospiraceae bacterium]